MITLIIFDLDGTLVDSALDITNALNHAVTPFGLGPLTVEMTVQMIGEGITSLIGKMLGEEKAHLKIETLTRFLDYYSEHLTDHTRPYPGVRETLQHLGRYRKVVISNKREDLSQKLLEDLNLASHFDIIMGSDTVREKKPSPMPLQEALKRLEVTPEEAVMVGDSAFDIQAGKAAGVRTIAVTYGYRPISTLNAADLLIDRFEELIPKLEGMDHANRNHP